MGALDRDPGDTGRTRELLSDAVPTGQARVVFRKADIMARVEVASGHTTGLLRMLSWVAASAVGTFGPGLTLAVLPTGFPTWGGVTVVTGQLAVAAAVLLVGHRADRRSDACR
jgi:hypothetical protein